MQKRKLKFFSTQRSRNTEAALLCGKFPDLANVSWQERIEEDEYGALRVE
jgi:hypothetical protein